MDPPARFWASFNLAAACIGGGTAIVMTFLIPLIVLLVNSDNPSGLLYFLLTLADGLAVATVAVWWVCRTDSSARSYVTERPILRAGPAIVLVAIAQGGVQIGVLGNAFGDTSGETVDALLIAVAALIGLWLVQFPVWRRK